MNDKGALAYRRFLDGDKSAFDEIFNSLFRSLVLFIGGFVHDVHTAEDLAIDTFSDLIVHRGRYNFKVTMKTYLFMIGRSRALDYIKHHKKLKLTDLFEADPEAETDVTVKLTYSGKLTCTYPMYENGWQVTAAPDGTLTDANGKEYNYLYWEGITNTKYDLSHGFCVRGKDTAPFLEEALARLGLNRREANEFIVYWLPLMQENEYNIISFQGELYQNSAKLDITPTPDTLIRVFMAWQKSDTYVEIPPQELTAPDRAGFTVIEWGGTEIRGYDE